MKISYHRRRKIKTRRIALKNLILRGVEDPKELAEELKVTLATIKRDLDALKTMNEEDLTFQKRQTPQDILDKKETILKMLDDEEYYNENGEINISKITRELKTSRTTVLCVLNGG
ncbi:MAG: HTH domain-containing protein [Campylobacteraceae bacterium]|jgi:predicted nucleotidyltransferase|nr:HTH domain-containing protein [Campylobacteraceae bacterium]MBT4031031.1 HTH domain-containing protein [Campylobacteraceae bacterium]MBT4179767.1 HTH domain-containing protein [Campylobacteraceae bacterium]MBT4573074.1 HTH domain-containing protein [Campylobacteraceae bacterium]MBT4708372.1 HTH domain-containing protein [Campylobacteraceae bacterium]